MKPDFEIYIEALQWIDYDIENGKTPFWVIGKVDTHRDIENLIEKLHGHDVELTSRDRRLLSLCLSSARDDADHRDASLAIPKAMLKQYGQAFDQALKTVD